MCLMMMLLTPCNSLLMMCKHYLITMGFASVVGKGLLKYGSRVAGKAVYKSAARLAGPYAKKYGRVLAVKAVAWSNRRKIVKGYNKHVKRSMRSFGAAKRISRVVKKGMRAYRKYTPNSVRRGMAW